MFGGFLRAAGSYAAKNAGRVASLARNAATGLVRRGASAAATPARQVTREVAKQLNLGNEAARVAEQRVITARTPFVQRGLLTADEAANDARLAAAAERATFRQVGAAPVTPVTPSGTFVDSATGRFVNMAEQPRLTASAVEAPTMARGQMTLGMPTVAAEVLPPQVMARNAQEFLNGPLLRTRAAEAAARVPSNVLNAAIGTGRAIKAHPFKTATGLAGLGLAAGTMSLLQRPEDIPVETTPALVPGAAPDLGITQDDVDMAATSEADRIDAAYNQAINALIASANAGASDAYLQTQMTLIEQQRAVAEQQLNAAYDQATSQVQANTAQMNQLMQDFARQAMADYQATAGSIPTAGIPGLTGEQAGMAGLSPTALGGAGITGMSEANALGSAANLGNMANILGANVTADQYLNQLAMDRAAALSGLSTNVADAQAQARLDAIDRQARAQQVLNSGLADVEMARAQALSSLTKSNKSGTIYKPTKQPAWYNTRIPANATGVLTGTAVPIDQANNILAEMDAAIASGDFGMTPNEFWQKWFSSNAEALGGFAALSALLKAAGRPTTVDGIVAAAYSK